MDSDAALAGFLAKMDHLTAQVRELRTDVRDVHDRLIKFEAQSFDKEISLLEARLALLEADMHRRSGAVRLGEFVPKFTGWLVAGFAILYGYYSKGN